MLVSILSHSEFYCQGFRLFSEGGESFFGNITEVGARMSISCLSDPATEVNSVNSDGSC